MKLTDNCRMCIIGSIRYENEMSIIASKFGCYSPTKCDNIISARNKAYNAILNSDVVLVYGDHIGDDTNFEIELAKKLEKQIIRISNL